MSFKAIAIVQELTHALDGTPITCEAKLVYLLLADCHDPEENLAWISVADLARESVMSECHCQLQLVWLEAHGEIRFQGVSGFFRSYRFLRIDQETATQPPETLAGRRPLRQKKATNR